MSTLLDFSDYVEFACQEQEGTFRSLPSRADAARSVPRFFAKGVHWKEPFFRPVDISPSLDDEAMEWWMQWRRARCECFGDWHYHSHCPYCREAVIIPAEIMCEAVPSISRRTLRICPVCGWWELDEHGWPDGEGERSIHRRGILREYDVGGSEAPIDAIRNHLKGCPELLRSVSPQNLEKLVGEVFRDFMDCEAIHIGGPNDNGIDLILIAADRRYVVQVKRRARADCAEAVTGIREFLGAMILDGAPRGLFVSTATRFSKNAIATANLARRVGAVEYIELVDARRLFEICELTQNKVIPAWKRTLSKEESVLEHIQPASPEMFYKLLERGY